MEKLYVSEIRPDGEVSAVGLFYSRAEAENVVAELRKIPEKSACRHEITGTVSRSAANAAKKKNGPTD